MKVVRFNGRDVAITEIAERVARALSEKRHLSMGGADADTLVQGIPNWHYCVDDAKVAIEALREPTSAMLDAGHSAFTEHAYSFKSELRELWPAMIDAALK